MNGDRRSSVLGVQENSKYNKEVFHGSNDRDQCRTQEAVKKDRYVGAVVLLHGYFPISDITITEFVALVMRKRFNNKRVFKTAEKSEITGL